MPHSLLISARAKIEWAKKHFLNLKGSFTVFSETDIYRYTVEDNAQSGERIYRAQLLKPMPEDWPLIVGDIFHNLRSALDHLAGALVSHNSPGADVESTAFPITRAPQIYQALSNDPKTRGMSKDALEVINLLKPYEGGNDGLWLLDRLNDIDEHRMLLVCYFVQAHIEILLTPPPSEMAKDIAPAVMTLPPGVPPVALEEDAILFRWSTFMDRSPMNVDPKFSADVLFNEPGVAEGKPVVPTIQQTIDLVESIVAKFEPLLV